MIFLFPGRDMYPFPREYFFFVKKLTLLGLTRGLDSGAGHENGPFRSQTQTTALAPNPTQTNSTGYNKGLNV